MTYPTAYDLKIRIDGVDRTANVVGKRVTIEDVLGNEYVKASLPIDTGAGLGLAGIQEVVISNSGETVRYFGGVIVSPKDIEVHQTWLKYVIAAYDFSWYLDHPRVLVDAEYTGQSDQAIIQHFMATSCPNIEVSTYVDEALSVIDYIKFDKEMPRKALERLKKMAGADFYVDFGPTGGSESAYLHYFAVARQSIVGGKWTVGASVVGGPDYIGGVNVPPFDLSDSPDGVTSIAYQGLQRIEQVPRTNRVTVVGRHSTLEVMNGTRRDKEQAAALSYVQANIGGLKEAIQDDDQDFDDWDGNGSANYMIVVTNTDRTGNWGYLGADDTTKVAVYQDSALTTNGWNGASTDPRGDGKTPQTYDIILADGDYGYWLRDKLVDNDLITAADLWMRGRQYLEDIGGPLTYTLMCLEPGWRTGQDVTLVNALRGLDTSLMLRRVTTRFTVETYARHFLELGAPIRHLGDVLAGGRNIWDEEKFLPKRPGLIEQEDAGTDVQAQHYLTTYNDQLYYPSYEKIVKSHSDILGTLVETIDNEELWLKEIYGMDSGPGAGLGAYMQVIQDGAAGAAYVPTEFVFGAYDDAGNLLKLMLDGPAGMADLDGHLGIRNQKELRLYDNGNYVGFEPPALAADQIWILPDVDGAVGDYLKTDGAGNLGWDSPPGGGDVVGPGAATDHAIARWDGVGGALLQDSGVLIDDTGHLWLRGGNEVRFYDVGNSNYIGFEAPALSADQIWVLPDADGNANDVMITDGAGNLSWAAIVDYLGCTISCPTNVLIESTGGGGTDVTITATDDITIEASDNLTLEGQDYVFITSLGEDIWLTAVDGGALMHGAEQVQLTQGTGATMLNLFADDVSLQADGWLGLYSYEGGGANIIIDGATSTVSISGTLSKTGGSFKIDHPLKPDTHWLHHSFVESPDMLNIYNGNVRLDKAGMAWMTLPSYFEALNRDYRYQVTAVNQAMRELHICEIVEGKRFLIAGGAPGGLVSWQVTGIRQDTWANENRIQVEVRKNDD